MTDTSMYYLVNIGLCPTCRQMLKMYWIDRKLLFLKENNNSICLAFDFYLSSGSLWLVISITCLVYLLLICFGFGSIQFFVWILFCFHYIILYYIILYYIILYYIILYYIILYYIHLVRVLGYLMCFASASVRSPINPNQYHW